VIANPLSLSDPRILAIDPGRSGAVVLFGRNTLEVRRDFKEEYDIVRAVQELAPTATEAVIEFVAAMPGQGVTSMFSFGKWFGVARGALGAAGFHLAGKRKDRKIEGFDAPDYDRHYIEVVPFRWQRYYRDTLKIDREDEFDSRAICLKLLPQSAPFLQRKKDHNTADALLIALWRQINPEVPTVQH